MDRGEAHVFLADAEVLGDLALGAIPRQRIAAAAQVDNRANAVRAHDPLERLSGRLSSTIDAPADDSVQVLADEHVAEPIGA